VPLVVPPLPSLLFLPPLLLALLLLRLLLLLLLPPLLLSTRPNVLPAAAAVYPKRAAAPRCVYLICSSPLPAAALRLFNLQLTFYRAISPPSLPLFCSHTTRRRRRRCWGWAGPPAKVSRSACQLWCVWRCSWRCCCWPVVHEPRCQFLSARCCSSLSPASLLFFTTPRYS
jgi:hypothetical protein